MRPGTMVRKGAAGRSSEDGMTPEISRKIRTLADNAVSSAEARKWMFEGGPIAPLGRHGNKHTDHHSGDEL